MIDILREQMLVMPIVSVPLITLHMLCAKEQPIISCCTVPQYKLNFAAINTVLNQGLNRIKSKSGIYLPYYYYLFTNNALKSFSKSHKTRDTGHSVCRSYA